MLPNIRYVSTLQYTMQCTMHCRTNCTKLNCNTYMYYSLYFWDEKMPKKCHWSSWMWQTQFCLPWQNVIRWKSSSCMWHTQSLLFPQEFLFDGSQALAVPLLQVPCHSPAVGKLHMAQFTTKRFAIVWMVILLVLQNCFLRCESFIAMVAVELSCEHSCWVTPWTYL